jgi:hypothetical protein
MASTNTYPLYAYDFTYQNGILRKGGVVGIMDRDGEHYAKADGAD